MKEEHTRDEVRNLILNAALEQFMSKGIKEVKMDDIASLLSVSKRTIYELFSDKEELLLEALKLLHERTRSEGKAIIRRSEHILDIILNLYGLYFELLKKVNKKFFTELERYPRICQRNKEREAKNNKKFLAWIELGRKQGLFREDADFEILAFIARGYAPLGRSEGRASRSPEGDFSPHMSLKNRI